MRPVSKLYAVVLKEFYGLKVYILKIFYCFFRPINILCPLYLCLVETLRIERLFSVL